MRVVAIMIWMVVAWAALTISAVMLPEKAHLALLAEVLVFVCITPRVLRWAEGK